MIVILTPNPLSWGPVKRRLRDQWVFCEPNNPPFLSRGRQADSDRETYSTARHSLGFYCCVAQTARYAVPRSLVRDTNLESAIEHGLSQTILSHPILQVGVVGEDTTSADFVHLPTLDLSDLVRWEYFDDGIPGEGDAILRRALEARHSTSWPDLHRRPGYQFIILCPDMSTSPKSTLTIDIIFAFHHAYGDGGSGVIVHHNLLQALNNPLPVPLSKSRILTVDHHPSPLPPPQDALIDFKTSWTFLLKTLWSEFAPSFLKPSAELVWAGRPISRHPEKTRLRLVSFPAVILSSILAHCKEHSTTLTPLLHILILRSLARRLPGSELANRGLTSSTPISLRRLIPPEGLKGFDPEHSMGVILASQNHRFSSSTVQRIRTGGSSDESLVWELTASLSDELRHKVNTLPDDDITALMGWVADQRARFMGMLGQERENTWEVSNVGAADFAIKGEGWEVERVVFSQSGSVTGSAFSVSVAGVKGGELAFSFGWQESIVEEDLVEGIVEDLGKWLDSFARTGRFGFADQELRAGAARSEDCC